MKTKKILSALIAASITAASLPLAACASGEGFIMLSAPYASGEKLWGTDYQSYSRILARYADDKTPIPMSKYYDGRIFATVPEENAGREIEAFVADEATFTDMPDESNESYYDYRTMCTVAEKFVIMGDDKGRARPYDNITRAEAAAVVMRMIGVSKDGNGGFNDVKPGDWFAGAVAAAKDHGVIAGEPDGNFYPQRNVSREEFTAMTARALAAAGIRNEIAPASVDDVREITGIEDADKISDWALGAYAAIQNYNIRDQELGEYDVEVQGYPAVDYAYPQNFATRKEAAELLCRVMDNFQNYPSETAVKYGFDKAMPVIDGSTSTYPFTEAVYSNLFYAGMYHKDKPLSHSKSHASYERLINGEVDMLFASVYPASDVLELAKEKGVELELIPIAYDAMIFFTNADNPAENLTKEQITNIYVDNAYENWNEIGGPDALLYPYCRNNDSGSHAQMEKHFLNGHEINEKIRNETTSISMSNVLTDVMYAETAEPKGYALGYSIYYYFNNMDVFYDTHTRLKLLSIDGISPTDETIADGTYPLANNTYIVMLKSQPENSPARKMAEFMLTEAGQACVKEAGYGPLKPVN